MSSTSENGRRGLPSMETILSSESLRPLLDTYGRGEIKDRMRRELDAARTSGSAFDLEASAARVAEALGNSHRPPLCRVINGTGVMIHTNLGRSPVGPTHLEEARGVLTTYSNLEIDLEENERGSRHHHIEPLARELFGSEGALLVNNNAAAVLLALSAMSSGREVIVSRGELVEIGGSFRIPEIIQQGGATLREVGTTNRTRASDFEQAVNERTGAILVVHQSNFRIVGFTEEAPLEELVKISREREVPLIVDEGSGRVVDLSHYGLPRRPTVRELIEMGVDLVTSSTDKLMGSIQGGLLVGRSDLMSRCRAHPLMRALRPGKETVAMVGAALSAFLREKHERELPLYRMLATPIESLWKRATAIAAAAECDIVESSALLGGGTTPEETVPSLALAFRGDVTALHASLRRGNPPILARLHDDQLLIDLRTIAPDEDQALSAALSRLRPR